MAIDRLLENSTFSPEDVVKLSTAYESALTKLGLTNRSDPITLLIAKRIIEIAETGISEAAELCDMALEQLGVSRTDEM